MLGTSAQVAWKGFDLARRGRGGGVGAWEGGIWLGTRTSIGRRDVLGTATVMRAFCVQKPSQGWESPWTKAQGKSRTGDCMWESLKVGATAGKMEEEAIADVKSAVGRLNTKLKRTSSDALIYLVHGSGLRCSNPKVLCRQLWSSCVVLHWLF